MTITISGAEAISLTSLAVHFTDEASAKAAWETMPEGTIVAIRDAQSKYIEEFIIDAAYRTVHSEWRSPIVTGAHHAIAELYLALAFGSCTMRDTGKVPLTDPRELEAIINAHVEEHRELTGKELPGANDERVAHLIAEVRRLSDELERIHGALMTSKPIFDVDPTARGPVSLIEYVPQK